MTTSGKQVKQVQPVEIDPNFFLPPNVVDMRYADIDEADDSATTRSDTGEVVSVNYDEVDYSDLITDPGTGTVPPLLFPPDSVTLVSQQVRVTDDGRFVVDVILEVEDIPGVINFDVRTAKI